MTTTADYPTDDRHDEDPEPEDDFPWIRVWALLNNFPPDVTRKMIRRARAEHAPSTAVASYFAGQPWHVLDEITYLPTRRWLIDYAESNGLTIPKEVMDHWLDPDFDPEREYGRSW